MSDREPIAPPPGDRGPLLRSNDEHAAGSLPAPVGLGERNDASTRGPSPYANKFRAVTAALVGLAVAAIVIAVAVGIGSDKQPAATPAWSTWQPTGTGALGAREIADHLSPFYRLSPTNQLAVVTVVNLTGTTTAAGNSGNSGSSGATGTTGGLEVAVQSDPSSGSVSLLSGSTIAYNLCGIGGGNCAIGVGQPSANRLLLLKREALELALYTFKYIGSTDNVVALLPPGYEQVAAAQSKTSGGAKGASTANGATTTASSSPRAGSGSTTTKQVNIALLFVRSELTPWLDQPLATTLPETFPPTVQMMGSAPEAGLVDQITARGLFTQRLVQAQDGSELIVLNPLPPQ